MDALLGVRIVLLIIYDMCSAIDREMPLSHIPTHNQGGRKIRTMDTPQSPCSKLMLEYQSFAGLSQSVSRTL